MLVAAMNPCPCGHHGDPKKNCRCNVFQIERYLGRISGPVLDRIDLQIDVPNVPYEELAAERNGADSAEVRAQVLAARRIQQLRFAGSGAFCNAAMSDRQVQDWCRPDAEANAILRNAVDTLGYSARSYTRVLKVALTIADLEAVKQAPEGGKAPESAKRAPVSAAHVSEALQYRMLDRRRETEG
jgi:magnesium chelatase family protein